MKVNIPIGKIIQEEVFQMNISLQELSERINIHKKKLLVLFNCKTIDIDILYKWCCVLNIDFFTVYSKYLDDIEESIDMETMRLNSFNIKLRLSTFENELLRNIS
jgi:transcriptional regulator with XRE-family HTH domain